VTDASGEETAVSESGGTSAVFDRTALALPDIDEVRAARATTLPS
jgi:hypothetical protein